jgi:hypothetical protein
VEVKVARAKFDRSGPETCALEVVLAKGRRIEVRRNFDAKTQVRLIQTQRSYPTAGGGFADADGVSFSTKFVVTDSCLISGCELPGGAAPLQRAKYPRFLCFCRREQRMAILTFPSVRIRSTRF